MTISFRDFRPSDLDAALELYRVSFTDELLAQGHTPESATGRLRQIARGNMIPFKVLAGFMKDIWGVIVAEQAGEILGLGAYYGNTHNVELGPLMVAPNQRRRGIGKALLEIRIERLRSLGVAYATTSVLTHNVASLGNLDQQGFTVYGELVDFDLQLPFNAPQSKMSFRPARSAERSTLENLESTMLGTRRVAIEESNIKRFYPDILEDVFSMLLGETTQRVVVVNSSGDIIGLMTLIANKNSTKAQIPYIITEDNKQHARDMLKLASDWAMAHGKQTLRITWPGRVRPLPDIPVLTNEWNWRLLVKELPPK